MKEVFFWVFVFTRLDFRILNLSGILVVYEVVLIYLVLENEVFVFNGCFCWWKDYFVVIS